jgi:hypothetical protein
LGITGHYYDNGYTFPAHTIIFATHTNTLFSTKGTKFTQTYF